MENKYKLTALTFLSAINSLILIGIILALVYESTLFFQYIDMVRVLIESKIQDSSIVTKAFEDNAKLNQEFIAKIENDFMKNQRDINEATLKSNRNTFIIVLGVALVSMTTLWRQASIFIF